MSNTFGQLFRVTTFGESHGGGVGVVIDGCPPNIELSERWPRFSAGNYRPSGSRRSCKENIVSAVCGIRDCRLRHANSRSRCENQSFHRKGEGDREEYCSLPGYRGGEKDGVADRRDSQQRRFGWWRY